MIATGRASQEEWTDKQGNKRTSIKVVLDEIGPTLRFATAKVSKAGERSNGQQQGGSDPWSTGGGQPANAGSGWGGGASSEPPF